MNGTCVADELDGSMTATFELAERLGTEEKALDDQPYGTLRQISEQENS